MPFSWLKLTPSVSLDYNHLLIDTYTERDAGALNLNVRGQKYDQVWMGSGLAASSGWGIGHMQVTPRLYGKLDYGLITPKVRTTSSFTGTDAPFDTLSLAPARTDFDTGMSLDLAFQKETSIRINYDAVFKDAYSYNTVSAMFKSKF